MPVGRLCARVLLCATLLASVCSLLPAQAPAPQLAITLHPAVPDAQGFVRSLDVRITVSENDAKPGEPLFGMPTVVDNVKTSAGAIEQLVARDAKGQLLLSSRTEDAHYTWSALRVVHGPITLTYRVSIGDQPNPFGAAPPFELRGEGRAISGRADTFLLLPAVDQPYAVQVHWDFAGFPAGAVGMSSRGVGDLRFDTPQPLSRLREVFLFGGLLSTYPEHPQPNGFFSAWQGEPPFDAGNLLQWTSHLYAHYKAFFRDNETHPYAVLLRSNLINAGGGVELDGAFIGTFDGHTDPEELKLTLAHEMVHTFVHGLDGDNDGSGAWFSEGIAEYYQRELPLRAGSISPGDFLRNLNLTAARYYTNSLSHTPNEQIMPQFWVETRVRVLPYDRGSLYFAALDSELRRTTQGKKSLDDLILAMLDLRRQHRPMNEQTWRALLQQNLGNTGIQGYEAMLRGDLVLPDSTAFGPCFRRATRRLRRYELGFDPKVLTEPTRIVRGIVPGSEAEKAGLRNGDHLLRPAPQDAIQADQNAEIHLEIERKGERFTVSYLPRGEAVEAYQWERVPGADAAVCAAD